MQKETVADIDKWDLPDSNLGVVKKEQNVEKTTGLFPLVVRGEEF